MYKILNDIHLHTIEAIEQNDLRTLEKNLEIYLEVLSTLIDESHKPNELKITKKLLEYLTSLYEKLLNNNLDEYVTTNLSEVYRISQGKIDLDLDRTFFFLYQKIRNAESITIVNSSSYKLLFSQIFHYSKDPSFFYYTRFMHVINSNKHLSTEEKHEVISIFFESIFFLIDTNKGYLRPNKEKDILECIIYMIKQSIDFKDAILFNTLLKKFENMKFFIDDTDTELVNLIISIYLYYLIFKEGMVSESDKKKYLSMLNKNKDLLVKKGTYHLDDNTIDYLYVLLNRWEIMNEFEVKTLIMDGVVREFLFFLHANYELYIGEDSSFLSEENIFSFLSYSLNQDGELGEDIKVLFSHFKSNFFGEDSGTSEIEYLVEKLKFTYMELRLKKANEQSNNIDLINGLTNNLKTLIKFNMLTHPLVDTNGNNALKENTEFNWFISYPTSFIDSEYHLDSMVEDTFRRLENFIINLFKEKGFIFKKLPNKGMDRLSLLESLVTKEVDTLLNGISEYALYDDKNKEVLGKYQKFLSEHFTTVLPAKLPVWVGFLSNSAYISLDKVTVTCEPVKEEMIISQVEANKINGSELYKVPLMNNIFINLNKKEAVKWHTSIKSVIKVALTLNYEIDEEKAKTNFVLH